MSAKKSGGAESWATNGRFVLHAPTLAGQLAPRARENRAGGVGEPLIAWQERTGYAAPMRCMMVRVLMLFLGVVGVPSTGLAAMQRPHCAQHDPSAEHQGPHSGTHQAPASTDSASWDSGTQHECPHCPASECARVAPCTVSSNAAVSEASATVPDPVADRVGVRRMRVHPYSATHQPPTPPPQLIS